MREADLPAQQPEAQEEARLPRPDEQPCRPGDPEGPSAPWPGPARRLTRRVKGRATFRALTRAPLARRGPLTLRAAVAHDGVAGVAFAVGRDVGHAVARNRLRRRLRAAIRDLETELEPGVSYLVGAGREGLTMSYPELVSTTRRLVREARRHAR